MSPQPAMTELPDSPAPLPGVLTPEKTALFLFGVFFIIVMLSIAIAIPSPTLSQWQVFNVVLALVAAAVGAVLPGALQLQFTPWLRAGGALAVFALVYLVKPAGLVSRDPFILEDPPSIDLALPVVQRWLSVMDAGNYDQAYAMTYAGFRDRYKKDDFVRLGNDVRKPLGAVLERKEVGQNSQDSVVGDRGHFRLYMYRTRFTGAKDAIDEWVTVFAPDKKTGWQAGGYHVNFQQVQLSPTTQAESNP